MEREPAASSILGNPELDRLAIVSFGLRHPHGRLLHSNFVAALLNDLFGIQARSGCFCAGPYVHRLYPIDDDWSARMDRRGDRAGNLGAKLSLLRLSFNYFISEEVFDYILAAVHFLAAEGWKLLPLYRFDPASGMWQHRRHRPTPLYLDDVSFTNAIAAAPAVEPGTFAAHLERARRIVADVETDPPAEPFDDPPLGDGFERGRWFPLPAEALRELHELSGALQAAQGR